MSSPARQPPRSWMRYGVSILPAVWLVLHVVVRLWPSLAPAASVLVTDAGLPAGLLAGPVTLVEWASGGVAIAGWLRAYVRRRARIRGEGFRAPIEDVPSEPSSGFRVHSIRVASDPADLEGLPKK